MDNGNGGPGNYVAQNFEGAMSEAPKFNPEQLPTPEDREKGGMENGSENVISLVDPSLLGASALEAMNHNNFGSSENAGVGEIVDEGVNTRLSTEGEGSRKIIGAIFNPNGNGVTEEAGKEIDKIKTERDLFRQAEKLIELKEYAERSYGGGQSAA